MEDKNSNVRVVVRVRPMIPREMNDKICLTTDSENFSINFANEQIFHFDQVYSPTCSQDFM